MNALITSLLQLIASAADLARKVVHGLIATASAKLLPLISRLRRTLCKAAIFPIRVIDVEETVGSSRGRVIFSKPTSWEFHTISHTWSKGVKSWSEIIADKVKRSEGKYSYDDLFRREDFSCHDCYLPFMEFLRLLRADGVKHVWLDALCINQGSESDALCINQGSESDALCINQGSDSGEKSQELQNMGSYYARSLGCYVCAHGFGEGFETWKEKESRLVMPRWFNRVWTFQEMLLPKRVTFILEIHSVIRRTINWSISIQKAQGINGPCRCAMSMSPFPQPRNLRSEEEEEEEVEEEICTDDRHKRRGGVEIIYGDSPCTQCGGTALIRRAKNRRLQLQTSPATADLYFIEGECICRLMIMAKEQLEKTVLKRADEDDERKLLRLEAVMLQQQEEEEEGGVMGRAWDPIQVVLEVSKRDCTHDEDRVLSILGLLGVEGAVQLRAGKTLGAQLLHLAQQLRSSSPTTLLKLCIAQFAGHSIPGMSWAPSLDGLRPTGEEVPQPTWKEFYRDEQIYRRMVEVEKGSESGLLQLARVMRYFTKNVEVENVLNCGSLVLCQAHVLWDCWFVRVQDGNVFHLQLKPEAANFQYQFQAYFSPFSCLLHRRVFVMGYTDTLMNQSIVRLEGRDLNVRLKDFRVCLVLLGELVLPNDEKHQVMMVCVGNKGDTLHKVGIAWLPGLEERRSFAKKKGLRELRPCAAQEPR